MTADPGPFKDQQGNTLSEDELFERLSEAILANVVACQDAGIPHEKIQMVVGQDGGTVIGDGMVFQTPVTVRLSEQRGRRLFTAFEQLLAEYQANRLPADRLAQLRAAHRVAHKTQAIRNARNAR